MKTFLLLFALAILFVVGSAGAMRYLDRRLPGMKKDHQQKP
ncbi:MAG TPA: hypothetical protein VGE50_02700 [Gammaproteobacteria bacterium]